MDKKKLLFIFGTRPEAIKMAPLILEAGKMEEFEVRVCITGQHKEMLTQVMDFFGLKEDHDLAIMQHNQTLFDITTNALNGLKNVLQQEQPHLVLVQGDTTTAFTGALAGYYQKVKVAHVEAGLRSGNKYAPFPEEINRKLAGCLADFHFPPTAEARENLLKENTQGLIAVTGNTVIDSLLIASEKVKNNAEINQFFDFLNPEKKLILVTCHRRENFGEPLLQICAALNQIAAENPDHEMLLPVHPNPNVAEVFKTRLGTADNIHLTAPLDYPYLVAAMNRCRFVITDSGGIQEEAPSLGKPVLVMREVTERMEGVEAGNALLVGADADKITTHATRLIHDEAFYSSMANAVNPYGDGTSARQILTILKNNL